MTISRLEQGSAPAAPGTGGTSTELLLSSEDTANLNNSHFKTLQKAHHLLHSFANTALSIFLCIAAGMSMKTTLLQAAGAPFPWRQRELLQWPPLRAQAMYQQQQRRWLSGGGMRCAAAAASQAVAPDPGGGAALMRVIDTELRTEAEQSYLAVRLISVSRDSPQRHCVLAILGLSVMPAQSGAAHARQWHCHSLQRCAGAVSWVLSQHVA